MGEKKSFSGKRRFVAAPRAKPRAGDAAASPAHYLRPMISIYCKEIKYFFPAEGY